MQPGIDSFQEIGSLPFQLVSKVLQEIRIIVGCSQSIKQRLGVFDVFMNHLISQLP